MKHIIIQKGGTLILKDGTEEIDITNDAVKCLFQYPVTLTNDVTMQDIYRILERDSEFYDILFNSCFVSEHITEILTKTEKDYLDISYIELSWTLYIQQEDEGNRIFGQDFPEMYGIGEDGTKYDISFTPLNKLANIPLKLNETILMEDENFVISKFGLSNFTLFHILYGIMWETSFYGSPQDKKKVLEDLQGRLSKNKK